MPKRPCIVARSGLRSVDFTSPFLEKLFDFFASPQPQRQLLHHLSPVHRAIAAGAVTRDWEDAVRPARA